MSQYEKFLDIIDGLNKEIVLRNNHNVIHLKDSGVLFIFDKEGNLLDTFNNKLRLEDRMTEEEINKLEDYRKKLNTSKTVKEVDKYGKMLNELFDDVRKRVKSEMYWID